MRIRRSGGVLVGILVVLAGPGATRAHAQGTSGLLPRQLTVDAALRIADALALSNAQRRAWLAAHDEYARVFADLHAGDVQWLLEHQGLMGLRGEDEAGHTARDFFDRRDRIIQRMAGLDATLFDTLSNYLADTQQPSLRRVRLARERYREVNGALLWFAPAASVDLIRDPIIPALDAADAAAIEPVLVEYEAALTLLTRQVHDRAVGMYTEIDERMKALTTDALDVDDPARAQEIMRLGQEAANELGQEAFAVAGTIRRLQRRTVNRLEAILPDASRFVRERFVQRLYPHFASTLPPTSALFDDLLAKGLPDDATRAAVAAIRDDHDARLRPVITARLDAEDRWHTESSPFASAPGDIAAYRETTATLASRLAEIDERTRTRLGEVVDPETLQRALAASTRRTPVVFDVAFQPVLPRAGDSSAASAAAAFRPIDADAWNELLRHASSDPAKLVRVADRRADYLAEFARRSDDWLASCRGKAGETPPDVAARFARRRETLAALDALDVELIAAVPSDRGETLSLRRRLARSGLVYEDSRRDDRPWFTVPCFSTLDVIDRAEFAPGVAGDLEALVTPSLRTLAPRFDDLTVLTLRDLELRATLTAEYRHPSEEDPADRQDTRGRLMTGMQESQVDVLRAVLAIVAGQESVLADLRDDVDDVEARTRLDRAARACLYPTILGQPDRGLEAVAATQAMEGPDPRQRNDLLALRALHVERTATLVARLVDIERERRRLLRAHPEDRSAAVGLYLPAQWYAFQRAEVEARTIVWRDLIAGPATSR